MNDKITNKKDIILSLNECKVIKIVNPINGALMDIDVPKFDVVLSNLPFISFEHRKEKIERVF